MCDGIWVERLLDQIPKDFDSTAVTLVITQLL